jgi:hypothetical protein
VDLHVGRVNLTNQLHRLRGERNHLLDVHVCNAPRSATTTDATQVDYIYVYLCIFMYIYVYLCIFIDLHVERLGLIHQLHSLMSRHT